MTPTVTDPTAPAVAMPLARSGQAAVTSPGTVTVPEPRSAGRRPGDAGSRHPRRSVPEQLPTGTSSRRPPTGGLAAPTRRILRFDWLRPRPVTGEPLAELAARRTPRPDPQLDAFHAQARFMTSMR
jgi:hypothetical protein